MKYKKESQRITVQFLDTDTEAVLFEIKDRNHRNVGELMSDFYANTLLMRELKGKKLPKNAMAVTVAYFTLVDDDVDEA
jgi:hypothetical protein